MRDRDVAGVRGKGELFVCESRAWLDLSGRAKKEKRWMIKINGWYVFHGRCDNLKKDFQTFYENPKPKPASRHNISEDRYDSSHIVDDSSQERCWLQAGRPSVKGALRKVRDLFPTLQSR
jgi:hypothetical protein